MSASGCCKKRNVTTIESIDMGKHLDLDTDDGPSLSDRERDDWYNAIISNNVEMVESILRESDDRKQDVLLNSKIVFDTAKIQQVIY